MSGKGLTKVRSMEMEIDWPVSLFVLHSHLDPATELGPRRLFSTSVI